jgi:hypothetical protein
MPAKTAEDKKKKKYTGWYMAGLFLATTAGTLAFSLLKGMENADIIRNAMLSGAGCFCIFFLMEQAMEKHLFDYDNEEFMGRFVVLYLACLILSLSCSYLPLAGWPYLSVFVLLSLFSNTLIGICSGSLLLSLSILLSGYGTDGFVLYFICGIIGAVLFRHLKDTDKVLIPIFLSVLFLLVCETAGVVIYANETLKPELFLMPFINVIINIVLLFVILKIFSRLVIYRYRDLYLEINDQEFVLLVKLKEFSRQEYYRAVHTAHFCERIGQKTDCDLNVVKAGGYYHRIGILNGEITYAGAEKLLPGNKFPRAVYRLLQEYLEPSIPIKSKEAAVLLLADEVVSAMLMLFSKDSNAAIDYDKVIDAIFKTILEGSALKECSISMGELTDMKNAFKEEKLYYDFLR